MLNWKFWSDITYLIAFKCLRLVARLVEIVHQINLKIGFLLLCTVDAAISTNIYDLKVVRLYLYIYLTCKITFVTDT